MRITALWKTLNGARFVDPRERVVKVAVSNDVVKVYFKDGDVETIHLVDYKMPEGEHVGFTAQLALKDLRAYAGRIAEAVGKRADELEDRGREDVAAVLKALLDLDLFVLLAEVWGVKRQERVVGRPALRAGKARLWFPAEVDVDSLAATCPRYDAVCKLSRHALVYPEVKRQIRDVWLMLTTRYWQYALAQFENI